MLNNPASEFQVVNKTADETVNNSTTFQDDDELKFALDANGVYLVRVVIFNQSVTTTPKMKAQYTLPAGTEMSGMVVYTDVLGAGQAGLILDTGSSTEFYATTSEIGYYHADMLVRVGGTAGDIQLQWAQQTATAENTEVKAGSRMIVVRIR